MIINMMKRSGLTPLLRAIELSKKLKSVETIDRPILENPGDIKIYNGKNIGGKHITKNQRGNDTLRAVVPTMGHPVSTCLHSPHNKRKHCRIDNKHETRVMNKEKVAAKSADEVGEVKLFLFLF